MGIKTPHNFRPEELKNYLINGNFYFWQRGTSLTATSAYGADRWRGNSAISTMIRVDSSVSPGLPASSLYGNRVLSLAGGGTISQRIEADMLKPLVGKTVTVSFKAGLISGTSPQMKVNVRKATAKDNWTSSTVVYSSPNLGTPASHTTTFTSYSYSFVVDADMAAKGIAIELGEDAGIWEIVFAEVMMNEGVNIAPFRLFGEDLEGELAACQRYFEKSYELNVTPGTSLTDSANTTRFYIPASAAVRSPNAFKVSKFKNPSVTTYSAASGTINQVDVNNIGQAVGAISPQQSGFWAETSSTATGHITYGYQWTANAEL